MRDKITWGEDTVKEEAGTSTFKGSGGRGFQKSLRKTSQSRREVSKVFKKNQYEVLFSINLYYKTAASTPTIRLLVELTFLEMLCAIRARELVNRQLALERKPD